MDILINKSFSPNCCDYIYPSTVHKIIQKCQNNFSVLYSKIWLHQQVSIIKCLVTTITDR